MSVRNVISLLLLSTIIFVSITHIDAYCNCDPAGSIGRWCRYDGQCTCKRNVQGQRCDECIDGTFDLSETSLFGCRPCDCDVGGSSSNVCNKRTGQCQCHRYFSGKSCSQSVKLNYFPSLEQLKLKNEFEDGYTLNGANVSYQFDENVFPTFSKTGYAHFSETQSEISNDVNIQKSSSYRLTIRYLILNTAPIVVDATILSDKSNKTFKILFKPNKQPAFVTTIGFSLDPARYTITLKTSEELFVDYFVFLPAAHDEPSKWIRNIKNPCKNNELNEFCRSYKYPSIDEFNPTTESYTITKSGKHRTPAFYDDQNHLSVLNEKNLSVFSRNQNTYYDINVERTGRYVLVFDYVKSSSYYYTDSTFTKQKGQDSDIMNDGVIYFTPCKYDFVCRGAIIDRRNKDQVKVFFISPDNNTIVLTLGKLVSGVAIKSITAIPFDQWSIDFIQPKEACVKINNECIEEKGFDQTHEFLKQCGQDHFNIQSNSSKFCKSEVSSLTAELKVKPVPCGCDFEGSTSSECESFGGQCKCKPNVVGRQCETCREGFIGFPDCKCPSGKFDSGPGSGCEDCNCNREGVLDGNLLCDLNNGTCVCRPNIVGRKCDKCAHGFHRFPHCDTCEW